MPRYNHNNYSFVIDSTFDPMSMQELMTPFLMYKDEYEKQSAIYDELSKKAEDMEYFVQHLPDGSKSKEIYDKYANDLQQQAEDLAKNGLSVNNRRALMNLKRRYAGEIGMLEKANTLRMAQMKEQHDLEIKDPTLMFSREARFSNLDDYLENPDLTYQSYSGALLAKQVNDAAASISKSLVDYMKGKPLDGNTRTWLQQHGLTAMEVAQAISNPQSMQSSRVLNTLMSSVMESSGITSWADPATLKRAYLYASQGLWKAIGEDKVSTYSMPKPTATSSKTTQQPVLPSLVPGGQQQAQRPAGGSGGSRRKGRGYEYAEGGYLYGGGGPKKIKISPQLGHMLDQMDDATYSKFLQEQTGSQNPTAEQVSAALATYNEKLIASMQENYYNQLTKEGFNKVQEVTPRYTLRNVATTAEQAQANQDAAMWKKYGKYFYKNQNGHYTINNEGRIAYRTAQPSRYIGSSPSIMAPISTMPSGAVDFKDWIDRYGLAEMANGRTGNYQSNIVAGMVGRINNRYDANLATEYNQMIKHTHYSDILARLSDMATDNELPMYERVKEGGSYRYKPTAEKISIDDLKDFTSASVNYGIHGNHLTLTTKKGKKVIIPFEYINPLANDAVNANLSAARVLRDLQKRGVNTYVTQDNNVWTTEEQITRALNAAYYNMLGAFGTGEPESVKRGQDVYIPNE